MGDLIPLPNEANAAAIDRFWEAHRGRAAVECGSCGTNYPGRFGADWRAQISTDTGEVDHVLCRPCAKFPRTPSDSAEPYAT